jgi:hypothetical protein
MVVPRGMTCRKPSQFSPSSQGRPGDRAAFLFAISCWPMTGAVSRLRNVTQVGKRQSLTSNLLFISSARRECGTKRGFVRDQRVPNEAKLIEGAFSRFLVTRTAGVCDNNG